VAPVRAGPIGKPSGMPLASARRVLRNAMRPLRCRVCGSVKIAAVYRAKSLILITCGECSAIRPVDPDTSKWQAEQLSNRKNSEQDDSSSVH
jgi:hypothetical protein